jgi:hypothetical protein
MVQLLAAVPVDFFGLCRKLARTRSTSSSAVNGRPLDFCLHRHPVSVNCLYHARMVLCVGGSFAYFARNARCTVTTDLLMWYSSTQNDFSPWAAIFSLHSHRLAAEMWTTMKNNLLGKKFLNCSFYLYRFRKYVSYGFPITKICNPGVYYETSCIINVTVNVNKWQLRRQNCTGTLICFMYPHCGPKFWNQQIWSVISGKRT